MKLRPKLDPVDPRQRYDIGEACDYLRVSRAKLYQDIKSGRVQTIQDGSRRYVPGSEIARLSTVQ